MIVPMDLDDNVNRMLAHLRMAPDAYLIGKADFSGPFTLLDKATLENPRPDWIWAIPGDTVRRLEQTVDIERFNVSDASKVGFRISSPGTSN
jgi:hypothetical protein